ncbi:MAG: tRNA 2-thiouridine(34) synthase MnmA [Nitrospirae bacterium]|nr:tRNA 2-thiouridine(34) synthase MnmA [Nitrospirota bacterium]
MKIAVGMSGGVDSAVTAALLKKEGHDVVGIHLRLYKDEGDDAKHWLDRSCCKIGLARHVVNQLKIPLEVFDVQEAFQSVVIDNFAEEYHRGRTPNPCVRCNETIKFGTLIEKAKSLGADSIATGHYAKIKFNDLRESFQLLRPKDLLKDQTYFLYRLKQDQLKSVYFPLAEMEKKEIYRIAEELDFPYEDVQESQEVCFVNQGDYRTFLREERGISGSKGSFVSGEGKILGEHEGVPFYTVGQRKGLGVAFGKRQFVIEIKPRENQIVLGSEPDLMKNEMRVSDLNWISGEAPVKAVQATVKIRYRSREAKGEIQPLGQDRVRVTFDEPQKGISPGQSAVFYQKEEVLGGGVID